MRIYCTLMLMNLISIVMVTCFNQSMSIRESGLDQPLLTWYPISVSKCVSNPYPDNLDNSVMEKKQVEICFHFLDELSVKWGINNEII